MNVASGFYITPLHPDDMHKTAFKTRYGTYEFNRLSMGLTNGPCAFSQAMHQVLENLIYKIIIAYIDDLIVPSLDIETHFLQLLIVFERMLSKGVKLKPKKCLFFQRSIDILGRIATGDSLSMSDKDKAVVQKWPVPRNVKEVARFTGLCSYHRAFIDTYAEISKPLYSLLKKGAKFSRDEQHQIAIEKLKEALTSSPILGLPRPEGTFIWVF